MRAIVFVSLSFAVGCGDAVVGQGLPLTNTCLRQPPLDYENTGDGLVGRHCRPCHSRFVRENQRGGAPLGIDFDDEADVLEWADLIQLEAVQLATMPPAGGMLPEERVQLEEYLRCNVFPALGRSPDGADEQDPEETGT